MRLVFALTIICAVSALPSSPIWQRWGHNKDVDPLGKHCFDVSVDTSDSHAAEWLRGNEYLYTKWNDGLCDSSVWPTVETSTHPGVSTKVTLRKLGHGKAAEAMAMVGKSKDCRSNKTTEAITIQFTNGAEGHTAKIRGCQDQYACKPYQDCELALEPKGTENIVIDSSFKYFVFTYKPADKETELYPDANLKYPSAYTIKLPKKQEAIMMDESSSDTLTVYQPSAGSHAHCTELTFEGGKNNAYYQAHGYQYQPPLWKSGACPNPPYNWFNNNKTIAKGVTQTELGRHTAESMAMVEGNSAYCMNDASKHAPFYCHCPPLPTNCKTESDCTNPWYKSYCMNDASKKAPYFCKQVMPPTCKTDKDCVRSLWPSYTYGD